MRHPADDADQHAAGREERRRKRRYGMRTIGAGARLLARLITRSAAAGARKKRRTSRKKT